MTAFVKFIMTGPPNADAGSFVAIVDDTGRKIDVGWWQHNGHVWEYVMPVRMVPELIPPTQPPTYDDPKIEAAYQQAKTESMSTIAPPVKRPPTQTGPALRQRLRDKVARTPKKEQEANVNVDPNTLPLPAGHERCPSCGKPFDPTKDELMGCGKCGEDKSTACCLTDPTRPCADCEALGAAADEQEIITAPPSVFDADFSSQSPARSSDDHDDINDTGDQR